MLPEGRGAGSLAHRSRTSTLAQTPYKSMRGRLIVAVATALCRRAVLPEGVFDLGQADAQHLPGDGFQQGWVPFEMQRALHVEHLLVGQ